MTKPEIIKDEANLTITIKRVFNAEKSRVWQAWTDPEILDKWWGPAPWKTETKSFEFKPGGLWLYCMAGPEGERAWSLAKYLDIKPQDYIVAIDAFCNENGDVNTDFPQTNWKNEFVESEGNTTVTTTLTFQSIQDMQKLIELQFEEGYSVGLNQLEELLKVNI